MNQIAKHKVSKSASTEAVKFTDGMLVTAEDLNAAMKYPLSVVQVLLRSYFGCGIVCGLGVSRPNDGKDEHKQPRRSFSVLIERGVALGCDGYPIELCEQLRFNFPPEPCGCPIGKPAVRYIAIRRITAPEPAPRACGCASGSSESGNQCSRLADHVQIEVFDRLPDGICMEPRVKTKEELAGDEPPHVHPSACECMTHCSDCEPCAEPWVLLATIMVDDGGVMVERVNAKQDVTIYGGPRWVKPIACLCHGEGRAEAEFANAATVEKKFADLRERVRKLEPKPAPVPPPAPAGPPASDATNAAKT